MSVIKKNKMATAPQSAVGVRSVLTNLFLFGTVTLLPLAVHNGYYDITEAKAVCFALLAGVFIFAVAVISLFDVAKEKSLRNVCNAKYDYTEFAVAAFAAAYLVAALLSDRSITVWLGVGARYQGAVAIVLYAVIIYMVSRNYRYSQRVLIGAVAAFEIVSLIALLNCYNVDVLGFYSVLTPDDKSLYISTIGNINFFSSYICLIFPLIIYGFCMADGTFTKFFFGMALAIGSLGTMLTASESFMVGFSVALAVIPLFFFKDARIIKRFSAATIMFLGIVKAYGVFYNETQKTLLPNVPISFLLNILLKNYIIFPVMAVCGCVWLLATKKPELLKPLHKIYAVLLIACAAGITAMFVLANTALKETSFGSLDTYVKITDAWGTNRGVIWRRCVQLYKELPLRQKLFGIGPENLYKYFVDVEKSVGKKLDQAHNEYLQYLVTTGIFGLVSYLSVLVCVSIKIINKASKNELAVALFAGLVAYWVQAFFNIAQPFSTPIMFTFIAWALAEVRASGQKTAE